MSLVNLSFPGNYKKKLEHERLEREKVIARAQEHRVRVKQLDSLLENMEIMGDFCESTAKKILNEFMGDIVVSPTPPSAGTIKDMEARLYHQTKMIIAAAHVATLEARRVSDALLDIEIMLGKSINELKSDGHDMIKEKTLPEIMNDVEQQFMLKENEPPAEEGTSTGGHSRSPGPQGELAGEPVQQIKQVEYIM